MACRGMVRAALIGCTIFTCLMPLYSYKSTNTDAEDAARGRACLPAHCFTAAKGDETGSNCGGSCQPCAPAPRRFQNQEETLICDVPAAAAALACDTPLSPASGSWSASGGSWAANPSAPIQVAISRQSEVSSQGRSLYDSKSGVDHWDVSCPPPQHVQPGFFEFGGIVMDWAEGLMPLDSGSVVGIRGLEIERISGDVVVVGALVGGLKLERQRGVSTDDNVEKAKPPAAGLPTSATIVSSVTGSFVACFDSGGVRKWLTIIEPQHPEPGQRIDRLGEVGASGVSLYRAQDTRLRVLVTGAYKKLPARFYHAARDTGQTMKGSRGAATEDVMCANAGGSVYGETVDVEQGAEAQGETGLLCDYTLVPAPRSSVAAYDTFVALYDQDGRVLWAKGQVASAEAAAAADTASGSIDGTSGMHVAVEDNADGAQPERIIGLIDEERQNGRMCYLGGTLQLAQRALLQSFLFPPHTSLLNRLPKAWSTASPLNVQVQGAVAQESRLAFVTRLWVSDRLLATHWVRLLGPLGTPFAPKYSLRSLAAGLLPLQPSPYDFVVVAAGTWSAASEGGVLASCSCAAASLNSLAGTLCGHVWYDPGENFGQYRDKESVLIKFQDDVGDKTRSGVGQLLSNGFIAVFRSNGSVLWTKGIGGTSEVVTVSTRDGFCSEGDNRGATDTESLPPTMYRQAASGAGAAGAGWTQTHVRRCSFVTAAGNLGQLSLRPSESSLMNVGVTRQPRSCSRHHTLGATDEAPPHLPCSGVLRSQGTSGDVWLVKYDVVTAIAEYAKLLGSRDSHEVVTDSSATQDGGVLLSMSMIAPFSIYRGTAQDTMGLVRSGRANAPGCRIENTNLAYLDTSTALQLGIPFQLETGVTIPKNLRLPGAASCLLLPHAPLFESGLLVKVVDGLTPEPVPTPLADAEVASGIPATHRWWLSEHGSQQNWRPARNCSRATADAQWSEIGCNSDGVVWARMLGNGQSFFSNQEARASKIASRSSPQDGLIVAGEFRGFLKGMVGGGFQADDLSPDIDGGFLNLEYRDVAGILVSLVE